MPALAPQSTGQELLGVLLLLLLLQPFVLLPVGGGLEGDAADVEQDAEDVGESQEGEGGESGCGDRVQAEDGQEAQRDPGCLREEGDREFGRGATDGVEAGVAAVFGGDAGEEEGADWDGVSIGVKKRGRIGESYGGLPRLSRRC